MKLAYQSIDVNAIVASQIDATVAVKANKRSFLESSMSVALCMQRQSGYRWSLVAADAEYDAELSALYTDESKNVDVKVFKSIETRINADLSDLVTELERIAKTETAAKFTEVTANEVLAALDLAMVSMWAQYLQYSLVQGRSAETVCLRLYSNIFN
jgi:hypothetical protein